MLTSNIEEIDQDKIDDCLTGVKAGHPLKRVKHGSLGMATGVTLDSDEDFIIYNSKRWSSIISNGVKKLPVSEILEVRTGWNTDNFQKISSSQKFCQEIKESRCFSIIFRHPVFLIKVIDLVADSPEVQQCWVIALRFLVNQVKKETRFFNEEKWLKENFVKADKNKNGSLSFKELWRLLMDLNLELQERHAKALFQKADFRKSSDFFGEDALDFDEFLVFFRSLTQRAELKLIMMELSESRKDYFTLTDLKNFIENIQKRPEISLDQCQNLIDTFEPELPNRMSKILSVNGLLKYLLSFQCCIFDPAYSYVYQDMSRPLNDYFIMSSHNTYLIGHQLKGDASIEAYISALKKGVRVLELDIWDSSPEPIVTHGHTLVNPIRLRDAVKAINDYAFDVSKYPVILSLEVHCTLKNQRITACIFNEIFGDKIFVPKKSCDALPSPDDLKERILLKGFKIPGTIQTSVWTPTDADFMTAENDPDHDDHKMINDLEADISEQHKSIAKEYSDLIALPIHGIKNIDDAINFHPFNAVANFSEKKMPEQNAPKYSSYVRYARDHLIRLYPFGLRTDSSNLNPLRFWHAGIQIVTLNIQHADLSNDLNDGFFQLNGGCGYVLKQEFLRKGNLDLNGAINYPVNTVIKIKIISAQYLPKPNTDNDIIDPYVLVEIHGLDCDKQTVKTKSVKNNGFNPLWNESFQINLRAPEFALVRFVIFDKDKYSADDFVAEYTLPAIALREGYSYVHLRTGYLHSLDPSAALLVHVGIDKMQKPCVDLTVESLDFRD